MYFVKLSWKNDNVSEKKLVEAAEMEASGDYTSMNVARGDRGRGRGRGRGGGKGDNWWMEKKKKQLEEKRKPKYVDIFDDCDYRHQDESRFYRAMLWCVIHYISVKFSASNKVSWE